MQSDLRGSFHSRLDELDESLASMFDLVADSLALLAGAEVGRAAQIASALSERDADVDRLCDEVENIVHWQLARQQPMGRDLRLLLTAVHIAPELERSHDLAVHVARDAALIDGTCDDRQMAFSAMAHLAAEMWGIVAEAFRRRDPLAAAELDTMDAGMDELQRSVVAGLGGDALDRAPAMQLVLLARFYERLGDHAVHLAARIRYLALGETAA